MVLCEQITSNIGHNATTVKILTVVFLSEQNAKRAKKGQYSEDKKYLQFNGIIDKIKSKRGH